MTSPDNKINMTKAQLLEFRKDFKLTQETLAELLGITVQAVRLWETDQRRIPETTARILRMFRSNPDLMGDF